MKIYKKLVRDNIPKIMKVNGAKPNIRILEDEEYIKELNKKLIEELNEYLEDQDIEELADIQEIIFAILDYKKVRREDFENIRLQKFLKRGGFSKKIFLESEE